VPSQPQSFHRGRQGSLTVLARSQWTRAAPCSSWVFSQLKAQPFGPRLRRQRSWAWIHPLEFEGDSPAQLLELRWKSIEQETLDSE